MSEEHRTARLQDYIQAGLILALTILLLVSGAISIGYMVEADKTENRYELMREDYTRLIKSMDTDLKLRIDRVRDVSEAESFTKDRRLRILEERADALDRELIKQKQMIEALKHPSSK